MGPITVPEQDLRRREERIDPIPGPIDDTWSEAEICWGSLVGQVSVQDIWSGSASVKDVDAPTKVPGGLQPCGFVGGR